MNVKERRTVEEILQSLRSGFRHDGGREAHLDETPAIAVSGEVSAPATDEAAGLPAEYDQQEQREESVPKHGRSDREESCLHSGACRQHHEATRES